MFELGFKLFASGLVLFLVSLVAVSASFERPRAQRISLAALLTAAALIVVGAFIAIWSR